jgi:hypothetical protein
VGESLTRRAWAAASLCIVAGPGADLIPPWATVLYGALPAGAGGRGAARGSGRRALGPVIEDVHATDHRQALERFLILPSSGSHRPGGQPTVRSSTIRTNTTT